MSTTALPLAATASPAGVPPLDAVSTFGRANALLREGRHGDAIALYRQLLDECVLPPETLKFNLELASSRLAAATLAAQAQKAKANATQATAGAGHAADDAFRFVERSHAQYLQRHAAALPARPPKVSVVMTCFNAQDTVRESVESLLHQSYPNLEIIVCDDHSADGTWQVLCDLQARCSGVKVLRNNANFGTYLSKNRALDVATGEIVLLQDSDDISHPDRVSVQAAPLLADQNLMATRTKYLRFDEGSGRIIPVAGLPSKFGLITLAVRRRAFTEIGYFDAVRRAGDDEWVQRLAHLYGADSVKNLDVTLYLARLRANSLVADMLTFSADGQNVDQSSSPARRRYVQQFRARNAQNTERGWYRDSFPPFPLRPNAEYPDTIRTLSALGPKVYASLCSIPARLDTLRNTIRSLENQVDGIHVYLDKYEAVPEDLERHPKLKIRRSQDYAIDHRDNGKFLPFDALKSDGAAFYFFCCDDDIVYPHDYVHTMIGTLRAFDHRVAAGVHGVVVEEKPRAYFRRRFNYHFALHGLDAPRLVNNLGTGTVAFHSSLFEAIDPSAWTRGGMVDIFFAVLCRQRNVPMVCVPRHAGWLVEAEQAKTTPTLFAEFNDKEEVITQALQACNPWGYQGIARVLQAQPADLRTRLEAALPPFHREISVTTSFPRMR